MAEELKDQVIEAQACYSLGNTYTLLQDYNTAVEYYLRHLAIAQKLNDQIGEGRAYWSLSNAMQAIGDHQKAMDYMHKHLAISKEIGDLTGQENAEMSISQLRQKLNAESASNDRIKNMKPKRVSMNKMELVSMTPDLKKAKEPMKPQPKGKQRAASVDYHSKSNDDFFDLVSKFQSKRMDDQRCSIEILSNKENKLPSKSVTFSEKNGKCPGGGGEDDLFDLIAGMQERRMDDQRATLPPPQSRNHHNSTSLHRANENKENTQRSQVPMGAGGKVRATRQYSLNTLSSTSSSSKSASTVAPDDDFLDLLMRSQANRLEDQRSEMPSTSTGNFGQSAMSSQIKGIDRPTSVSSTQSNSPVRVILLPRPRTN